MSLPKLSAIDIQRAIIAGLAIESFNPDEINKRLELFELIFNEYLFFFTKNQQLIIKLLYKDAMKYKEDGVNAIGMSEITQKKIISKYPFLVDEIIEILGYGAITEDLIRFYLKELEKIVLTSII